MRDFNFWLGLPYVLQGSMPEIKGQISSVKQDLEVLI